MIALSHNIPTLAQLALLLWPEHTLEDLIKEFTDIDNSEDAAFFLAYDHEEPVGFAQCQLRHEYVEGTDSSPVGYLEGIFVKENYRSKGYARQLLAECEKWAITKGCCEFASDCELDNVTSLQFHLSMCFEEVNRIICFTKKL